MKRRSPYWYLSWWDWANDRRVTSLGLSESLQPYVEAFVNNPWWGYLKANQRMGFPV